MEQAGCARGVQPSSRTGARAAPRGRKRYLRALPRNFSALVGTGVARAMPPNYYRCASCYVRMHGSWGEVMEEETRHARAAWGL